MSEISCNKKPVFFICKTLFLPEIYVIIIIPRISRSLELTNYEKNRMKDNTDRENREDILYVLLVIVLSSIYALLFTLDPLGKDYSQTMIMGILTGLFIVGQLPFIKRKIKRTLFFSLIMVIQIVIYLVI